MHPVNLRIDNSGCSVMCAFDHTRKSLLVIITYDIPNKREYFYPSFDRNVILNLFDLRLDYGYLRMFIPVCVYLMISPLSLNIS